MPKVITKKVGVRGGPEMKQYFNEERVVVLNEGEAVPEPDVPPTEEKKSLPKPPDLPLQWWQKD